MTDTDGPPSTPTRFVAQPGVCWNGRGCVAQLEAELERAGHRRAMVVCGNTVGSTPAVMRPVTEGLGGRLAGVFAETTPQKRLSTALAGAKTASELEADVLVSVGGGSSLDTAKVISVVVARQESPMVLGAELEATGQLTVPDGSVTPVIAVPTTLAGADLSQAAGVTATPKSGLVTTPVSGSVSAPLLFPAAVHSDPALVETTPPSMLAGSAMNGFNKGLETLYSRHRTPITDATARRGLERLAVGLPGLKCDPLDETAIEQAVEGALLVQYGISKPDGTTLSIIHAFGHGLRHHTGIQQGIAHAIVTPHALSYLFEQVDGRRRLIADALGVSLEGQSQEAIAARIVEAVTAIRDALEQPTQLSSVDGLEPSAFTDIAETILEDRFLKNRPVGLEPTVEDIRGVLEAAWDGQSESH